MKNILYRSSELEIRKSHSLEFASYFGRACGVGLRANSRVHAAFMQKSVFSVCCARFARFPARFYYIGE